MKYEMIFGDAGVFDGAHECATHATKGGGFYYVDTGVVKFISNMGFGAMDVCELTGHLVAERRIIKEPKRWTWEDKKAGRLPEVGSTAQHKHLGVGIAEILVTKDGFIVVQYVSDNKILTLTNEMFLEYFNPIETPAEKAQREEDEFFFALKDEWQNPKSPQISSASFEVGVRAAYRKLKGGE